MRLRGWMHFMPTLTILMAISVAVSIEDERKVTLDAALPQDNVKVDLERRPEVDLQTSASSYYHHAGGPKNVYGRGRDKKYKGHVNDHHEDEHYENREFYDDFDSYSYHGRDGERDDRFKLRDHGSHKGSHQEGGYGYSGYGKGYGHSDHGKGYGHSDHGKGYGHSDHGKGYGHSDHGKGYGHSDHGKGYGHSDHGKGYGHSDHGKGYGHSDHGKGYGHSDHGKGYGHSDHGKGYGHSDHGKGYGHSDHGKGYGHSDHGKWHSTHGSGYGHGNGYGHSSHGGGYASHSSLNPVTQLTLSPLRAFSGEEKIVFETFGDFSPAVL